MRAATRKTASVTPTPIPAAAPTVMPDDVATGLLDGVDEANVGGSVVEAGTDVVVNPELAVTMVDVEPVGREEVDEA